MINKWVHIPCTSRRFHVRAYVYRDKYSCSKSGLWPFGCKVMRYRNMGMVTVGFMFHFLTIADASVKVTF